MSNSHLKHLRKNKWFHGTTLAAWHDICEQGIISNYNKGNELDFGYGFYLTPIKEQAEHFIKTMLEYRNQENFLSELITNREYDRLSKIAIVIEFTFSPMEWIMAERYKYLILNAYDDHFADFVFHNRINNSEGEYQHDYDFVFGVMSDSNPIVDVVRYKHNEIGESELKESFKVSTSRKQLSIHNQSLCDIIEPTKVYIIETGEELRVDDYFNKRKSDITGRRVD